MCLFYVISSLKGLFPKRYPLFTAPEALDLVSWRDCCFIHAELMNVQLATNMWNVDITTLLFINAGFAGYDDLKIIATQFFISPL